MGPRPARATGARRTTWIGRLVRRWRPDHNPLRRGTDRAELAVRAVLVAAFLGAAPFAAHSAAAWASTASVHELHAQQATFLRERATLLDRPVATAEYGSTVIWQASVRWHTPTGQLRTGTVTVSPTAAQGSTAQVWTDHAGHLVTPLDRHQIPEREALAGTAAVAILAIVAVIAGLIARRLLDRRRIAAWDADWVSTEPRWTSRR